MQSTPLAPSRSENGVFQVGILIFDDVELLDFAGPFEVFSVAGRIVNDGLYKEEQTAAIRVLTIAQSYKPIHTRGDLLVQPQYTFNNHPLLDLLIVPGGWGTRREADNSILIGWLHIVTQTTPINASICTGAFLLGKIGLFEGRKATTHWDSLERMVSEFPQIQVIRDVRWVDEGNVLSSAGVSAGIDMSLHLVERLYGLPIAEQTARQMAYYWEQKTT